jgi:hypothetical protein
MRYSKLYVTQLLAGYLIAMAAALLIDDKSLSAVAMFWGFAGAHFVYLSHVLRPPELQR